MSFSLSRYELAAKFAKINLALSQRSPYLTNEKKKKGQYKAESRQAFFPPPSTSMT